MKHILVIDDDRAHLTLAYSVLKDIYRVTTVTTGRQALEFLENEGCDMILMDINMPEMDGFEIMKRIHEKEELEDIPIVFLTADGDAETESRCLKNGAVDFIVKPVVPIVVRSRIGRILEAEDMRRQLKEKLKEKIQEVSMIKSKAQQDALTGLWNRTYTEDMINTLIENGVKGALFMIDMDNFKAINDNYGHIAGDNVLRDFADTMRKFSTSEDILCRIGGDEFVMFINRIASKRQLGKLADDIISDLCNKLKEKQYDVNSSVSIGIALIPEDGLDFNAAYNAADKALYYVKQNGKNAYRFFNERRKAQYPRERNLVDLKCLREMMNCADSAQGAYMLDIDNFRHVYNFIQRFVERSNHNIQTLLFTAHSSSGMLEPKESDEALDLMMQAICMSLRRSDISTRYSGRQVIAILMDANSQNGDMVAQRILKCFYKLYTKGHVLFEYDIVKV